MNLIKKFTELSEKRKLYIISIWILILVILYIIKYFAFERNYNKNFNNNMYHLYDLNDEKIYFYEDTEDEENEEDEEDMDFVGPVKNFCEYCENGEYEKAYNMLSENSKKTKFLNQNDFEKYIKTNFNENSVYNVEIEDILEFKYIIEIYDNVISTGKWEKNNLREINVQIIIEENGENEDDEDKIEIL